MLDFAVKQLKGAASEMLAMDNTPDSELALQGGLALPGLTLTPLATPHTTAHFDLSLLLSDDNTGLTGELEYACDLFDRATVERFAAHFLTLLEGMTANDATRVATLPLMTQAEQDRVLVDFNDVPAEKPSDSLIHEQFEACAAANPPRFPFRRSAPPPRRRSLTCTSA